MTLQLTAIYASLIALIYFVLEVRVSALRGKLDISILHGDSTQLAERIRQHGNLAEHAPIVLILMGLAEMNNASPTWLHAIGGILLIARIMHPLGLRAEKIAIPGRLIGAVGTNLSMLIAVFFLLSTMISA